MANGELTIGWARGDITPPRKTLVQGQFHTRISDKAVSPLTATARGQSHTLSLAKKGDLEVPLLKAPEMGAPDDTTGEPQVDGLMEGLGDPADGEQVMIVLDRGDGLRVRMSTPVAGWLKLAAAADPEARALTLTLHGEPTPMSRDAHALELPAIAIEVVGP